MCDNLKSASQPYLTTQKLLLGVCSQTCTELVILESKNCSAKSFITKWQQVFLRKLSARDDYEQSLIHHAIDLAKPPKCEMGVYFEKPEKLHQEPIQEDLYYLYQTVQQSDSFHSQIYKQAMTILQKAA